VQVATELRALGYGEDVLAEAREITDATAEVLATKFKGGLEQLWGGGDVRAGVSAVLLGSSAEREQPGKHGMALGESQ